MSKQTLHDQIRQGIKPEGMSFMLFDYAGLANELDEILKALTRNECAKRCGDSIGCCVAGAYKTGGATKEMLQYQEQEGNGQRDVDGKCQYHAEGSGCTLVSLFRPPKCLTTLCGKKGGLKDYLVATYGREGQKFVEAMAEATDSCASMINGDKGETLFLAMEEAIAAGRRITEKEKVGVKINQGVR